MFSAKPLLGSAALSSLLWLTPALSTAQPKEADPWQAEALLLHRQVTLTGLTLKGEPLIAPSSAVLVVHLWSLECAPCLKELPALLSIMRGYAREPRLRFLLISESADAARAQDYLQRLGSPAPRILSAQGGSQLRALLQDDTQPMTLLLDRHHVVRQAFRGSLLGRRTVFTTALDQLLRLSHL